MIRFFPFFFRLLIVVGLIPSTVVYSFGLLCKPPRFMCTKPVRFILCGTSGRLTKFRVNDTLPRALR
jgi:hypothetical protein